MAVKASEISRPSLREFPARKSLPPFVTKRRRQKCPQGTFVGIGRRFSLSGHKRLRCFAHPLRALEPPFDLFPPPVQCGGCCALRATMIIRLRPYMAGPRPARSHCFRYFSRCLIFWCFWIKPKAQEKLRKGRTSRSILREESRVFDGASAARSPFPIFRKAERWALCAAIVCVISRTCNPRP